MSKFEGFHLIALAQMPNWDKTWHVLVYPKFMYLVFMLHLLFSWCFVWWLVCFCVCCVSVLCRCSPLIFNAFRSVLVCYPDFVFCPWIYEFWIAVYYCCLYLQTNSITNIIYKFVIAVWDWGILSWPDGGALLFFNRKMQDNFQTYVTGILALGKWWLFNFFLISVGWYKEILTLICVFVCKW